MVFIRNLIKKVKKLEKSRNGNLMNREHINRSHIYFTNRKEVSKVMLNHCQKTTLQEIIDTIKWKSSTLLEAITIDNNIIVLLRFWKTYMVFMER